MDKIVVYTIIFSQKVKYYTAFKWGGGFNFWIFPRMIKSAGLKKFTGVMDFWSDFSPVNTWIKISLNFAVFPYLLKTASDIQNIRCHLYNEATMSLVLFQRYYRLRPTKFHFSLDKEIV